MLCNVGWNFKMFCVYVYGIASLKLKAALFDLHATDKYTYRVNTWNTDSLNVIMFISWKAQKGN